MPVALLKRPFVAVGRSWMTFSRVLKQIQGYVEALPAKAAAKAGYTEPWTDGWGGSWVDLVRG